MPIYDEISHLSRFSDKDRELRAESSISPKMSQYGKIKHALDSGRIVSVYSGVLNDRIAWMKDDEAKGKASRQVPELVAYTLAELDLLAAMGPEDIRFIHGIKQRFSATVEAIASQRSHLDLNVAAP